MHQQAALSNLRRRVGRAAFYAAMRARIAPAFHQNDLDEILPSDKLRTHDATMRAQPRLGAAFLRLPPVIAPAREPCTT
jgi:hypothetical protein